MEPLICPIQYYRKPNQVLLCPIPTIKQCVNTKQGQPLLLKMAFLGFIVSIGHNKTCFGFW